jgi:hypothetical protein
MQPSSAAIAQRIETGFDFKNPDYVPIFRARVERLQRLRHDIRQGGTMLRDLRWYYRDHTADFINDWAVTIDPRVSSKGRSSVMPFLLFDRQREFIDWMLGRWRASEPGLMDKSRDVGASWLFMAASCTLCLFHEDMMIGVGSAKEDKVDRSGDPDCLFYKGRMFLQYLPPEFLNGWQLSKHSAHMRLNFPATGSSITGEAGDNIGRGGRKAIYGVDESAHVERPQLIDASLAATTDCRLDMSSVNGMNNSFAERRHSGKISVFTFHWRDDPRKDDAWYKKKCDELDPVIVAQELDLNYTASMEGVVIPSQWVQAAIDLHKRLGLEPSGIRRSALDVADEGRDKNAWGWRHGVVLMHAESWKGKDSDIFATTERAFRLCDEWGVAECDFDGDGLGAGVRGDARKINEERAAANKKRPLKDAVPLLYFHMFRGSGAVLEPEKIVPFTDRKNKDFFENFKAQSWWSLRFRFQQSWRASQGMEYKPDEIISISSGFAERQRLVTELSQVVYKESKSGKIMIDKTPDGMPSPNLADQVMMLYAPRNSMMAFSDEFADRL